MSDLPVPPEELRVRVQGDANLAGFEEVGRILAGSVAAAIDPVLALGPESRILDFGCGCGRVFRYLRPRYPDAMWYATDIDGEAIAWCRGHMNDIGTFSTNQAWPPLDVPDGFFDFIYGVSVMTHLPEAMQVAWLGELRRVARPGAYVLLTTHGPDLAPPDRRAELDRAGFLYLAGPETAGLPAFYRTTYHTPAYVWTRWGGFFTIVSIIPKGMGGFQDVILCRRS